MKNTLVDLRQATALDGATAFYVYRGHVVHWRWMDPDFLAAVRDCIARRGAWLYSPYASRVRREAKAAS